MYHLQSITSFRRNGLPSSLLAEHKAAIRRDPQLLNLEDRYTSCTRHKAMSLRAKQLKV